HLFKTVIYAKIRRIRLGHADHLEVGDVLPLDNPDTFQLAPRQRGHFTVRQIPHRVRLVTEILDPNPHRAWVLDHIRTPVIEDLQPASEHVGFLDVYPVVLNSAGWVLAVFHTELLHQQTHRNEVAVLQIAAYLA